MSIELNIIINFDKFYLVQDGYYIRTFERLKEFSNQYIYPNLDLIKNIEVTGDITTSIDDYNFIHWYINVADKAKMSIGDLFKFKIFLNM